MTSGKCARCGAEDSMFWYPYAFGIAPIPDGRSLVDCQRYMLCDECQMDFVKFMQNRGTWFDLEQFKMLNDKPMPLIPEVKE